MGALPSPPPTFLGRGPVLRRVVALLRRNRGVAICGLAGLGKTAVALAAARLLRKRFSTAGYVRTAAGDDLGSLAARVLEELSPRAALRRWRRHAQD